MGGGVEIVSSFWIRKYVLRSENAEGEYNIEEFGIGIINMLFAEGLCDKLITFFADREREYATDYLAIEFEHKGEAIVIEGWLKDDRRRGDKDIELTIEISCTSASTKDTLEKIGEKIIPLAKKFLSR